MTTSLAVLDMAGTTVADDGLVVAAFDSAVRELGVPAGEEYDRMLGHVRDTMGQSKITVFRDLYRDETLARRANLAFEQAYARLIDGGSCAPVDGAEQVLDTLRRNGTRVALTTGFSAGTQRRLLAALGWTGLADLALAPSAGIRGRPHPDLVLAAVLRLGIDDVREVAVVGDTAADIRTGLRAGARIVAGVLTGAHDGPTLRAAGATHVLDSIRALPELLQEGV